ncbi:hypothetical protein [Polyangium fumosum]|uniref:hypothetical protein n=1 Tax=Polyangium fumosum TaxID=889272 RepID=UPI001B85FA42|nr:hypothetical protein [Polyangium fumosum]
MEEAALRERAGEKREEGIAAAIRGAEEKERALAGVARRVEIREEDRAVGHGHAKITLDDDVARLGGREVEEPFEEVAWEGHEVVHRLQEDADPRKTQGGGGSVFSMAAARVSSVARE